MGTVFRQRVPALGANKGGAPGNRDSLQPIGDLAIPEVSASSPSRTQLKPPAFPHRARVCRCWARLSITRGIIRCLEIGFVSRCYQKRVLAMSHFQLRELWLYRKSNPAHLRDRKQNKLPLWRESMTHLWDAVRLAGELLPGDFNAARCAGKPAARPFAPR
jgi:hypothetical protein